MTVVAPFWVFGVLTARYVPSLIAHQQFVVNRLWVCPVNGTKLMRTYTEGGLAKTCGMVFLFELEAIGADSEEVEREGNNLGAYNDLVTALPFLF